MSNRIFQAVWDYGPQSRSEMLVLMVLADSADAETAECFPSIRRIAAGARMSVSVARRTLRALESEGWITSTTRQRENGSQASSIYTVQIEKLGLAPLVTKGAVKTTGGAVKTTGVPRSKRPGTGAVKMTALEHTIKNKEPAALNLDQIGRYGLSCLREGKPLLVAGVSHKPGSAVYSEMLDLLRR